MVFSRRFLISVFLVSLLFAASGCMSGVHVEHYGRQAGQAIGSWLSVGKNPETTQFKDTFLVIDTSKPAMWLEYKGHVVEEMYTDLSEKMKWSVHHITPDGTKPLPDIVRLRSRGHDENLVFPESICLAGTGGGRYVQYTFDSHKSRIRQGTGNKKVRQYEGKKTKTAGSYDSIIVGHQEYTGYLAQLEKSDKGDIDKEVAELFFHGSDVLRENAKQWRAVEKLIYDGMIRHSEKAGFAVNHIRMRTGPDYLAGHAEIDGGWPRFLSFAWGDWNFNYEYLGEGVWYVVAVSEYYSGQKITDKHIEFLVSADGEVSAGQEQRFLAMGRDSIENSVLKPSRWRAQLENGLVVELIGICEHPSGENVWFGPDGSDLGFVPYSSYKRQEKHQDDSKIFNIAWRIRKPRNYSISSRSSMIGSIRSFHERLFDKYGYDSIDGDVYGFRGNRDKTTFRRGIRFNSGRRCWFKFENISLVRGENMGLRIIVGDEANSD